MYIYILFWTSTKEGEGKPPLPIIQVYSLVHSGKIETIFIDGANFFDLFTIFTKVRSCSYCTCQCIG